ncbi:MAG TPA: deoxyribose-phosphate aldolase [Pseudolysinimonas sp.]|nr:deoxyribose-phosphate aldolase [Pseudolysinimonas sp.]
MTTLDFDRLRRARALEPAAIRAALDGRVRRDLLTGDGRLFILAADHPGRGALGVGDEPMAMADRYDLLERLVVALAHPGVDGFLGTADLLEDLAFLGALEGKVAVGSMNRGGIKSSVFEMDDRVTGYDVDSFHRKHLDFAKLLLRINLEDPSSVRTLVSAAEAVSHAAEIGLPIMIEPFMSTWLDGSIRNDLRLEAVVTSVAIASALGSSSAYSWLKLPVVPDMERVMKATTLPTLLLGGDPLDHPVNVHETWARALDLPGVHGLVVGRSLLYPSDGDVESAVDRAAGLVHHTS